MQHLDIRTATFKPDGAIVDVAATQFPEAGTHHLARSA